MPKATATLLQIDLNALEHNFNYLRSQIKQSTRFMAVVKAFAYGSEATRVAKKLENLKVDYFAVAYVAEGVALREAGIKTPILVLHPQPAHFSLMIQKCLEPSLYAPRMLRLFLEEAKKKEQQGYPVHLKFNTGLNRLGFWENDVDYIQKQLHRRSEVKVVSVFSHLAASEDPNEKNFSEQQIATFDKIAAEIQEALKSTPLKHLLNTSGILNYPDAQYDMVRSGIGLYGYSNHKETDKLLKPVCTLKTIISQIHKIEPGETVGYNRAYASDGYRITATLPIGHADGIGRQYGNEVGWVTVHGQRAPIIGNVCMDMLMIDITDIPCKEGDEVVLFGPGQSAETLAAAANTISYELITGISQRVERVFVGS